jgi:hypothetical protein
MFRRPRTDLVASLSATLLLICAVGAVGALLLLGRADSGAGWAGIAVLVAGAALVAGHLVDLVLPRPQLAFDVPRGLVGLLVSVLAGAGVALVGGALGGATGAGPGHLTEELAAVIYGAVLAAVAALMAVAASYIVVEATAVEDGTEDGDLAVPRVSPWPLAIVQAVLPLAACAPVALALQAAL